MTDGSERRPGRSRGSGSQDQEHVSVHPLPAAGEQAWEEAGQANGHDILIAGWHIPSRDVDYHELGADYFDIHAIDPRRKANRITQQLHALGYRVTLEPVAWSDGLVIFES